MKADLTPLLRGRYYFYNFIRLEEEDAGKAGVD